MNYDRIGLVLSACAFCILLWALHHVLARRNFPPLEHGGLHVSGSTMKWLWSAAFAVAFLVGGPTLMSRSSTNGIAWSSWTGAQLGQPATPGPRIIESGGWSVRIASFGREVRHVTYEGYPEHSVERHAVYAPLWLVLAVLFYMSTLRAPGLPGPGTAGTRRGRPDAETS